MQNRMVLTNVLLILTLAACASDPNRRTPGVLIDDMALEPIIKNEIFKSNSAFKGSHIVVVSLNGIVLLAGQVASEALLKQAGEVAGQMRRVRKVHNELTIGGPTSLVARTNDSWLTTKVKARLIASESTEGLKVKVLTENGVVYLMGSVTRAQADATIAVASNVYGVQKIVKVFKYVE